MGGNPQQTMHIRVLFVAFAVAGAVLVWNAAAKLGSMHVLSYVASMSADKLAAEVRSGNPVVVNVRDGTHWVLVNGYDNSKSPPTTFYVNDPGFEDQTYEHHTMLKFVTYGPGRTASAVQEQRASLEAAKKAA